jgi:NitT/TauT family transport system permease protein
MKRLVWLLCDRVVPPLLFLTLMIAVWHTAVLVWDLKPFLLPGPDRVWNSIAADPFKLLRAMVFTGAAAGSGFCLSLLLGIGISLVFSQSRWIRSSGYPYAIFLQTVPIVAIAPLIVHWCGRGFQSIVVTAFIISLFPIIANGTQGMLAIDPDLLDLFRLNGASRWQVLWKLRLPSAIPALCSGARTAAGLAVVGAIVGEFFAGYGGRTFGLGYLILLTSEQTRMADLFAAVLASTLLGLTIFAVVSVVTSILLHRWSDSASDTPRS